MLSFFQNFLYLSSWMISICDCMSAVLPTEIDSPESALQRTSPHVFSLSSFYRLLGAKTNLCNDKDKSIPSFTSSLNLSQGILSQFLPVLSIVVYDTQINKMSSLWFLCMFSIRTVEWEALLEHLFSPFKIKILGLIYKSSNYNNIPDIPFSTLYTSTNPFIQSNVVN